MYFCPCPCSDPHDPEAEETARVVLPRNLSYVQESYLDRYSVSAGFVHDPKSENNGLGCEQQQLAHGADAGIGERTHPSFSSSSNVISTNVEDETIALLSILKAKDFPVGVGSETGCTSHLDSDLKEAVSISTSNIGHRDDWLSTFNGVGTHTVSEGVVPFSYSKWTANSIGFLDERGSRVSFPPSSQPTGDTSSNQDSVPQPSDIEVETQLSSTKTSPTTSSVSLLLSPASRVASRLSSLLHTPPNESMEAERNGTSVDGETLSAALQGTHSTMQAPVGLGEDMDRGQDIDTAQFQDNGSLSDNIESRTEFTVSDYAGSALHLKSESGKVFLSGQPPRSEVLEIKTSNRPYHPTGSPPEKDSMPYRQKTSNASGFYESPDSDAFSEEGVFVNMMDDLIVSDGGNGSSEGQYNNNEVDDDSEDENNKSISTSVKSDETCLSVDSMFMSPEECEVEEDVSEGDKVPAPVESSEVESGTPRKMSLQEAISRAASDLSRMSIDLYGSEALLQGDRTGGSQDLPIDGNGGQAASKRSNLSSWGRSSPVKTQKDLKLTITDYSSSSSSSITSDHIGKMDSGSTDLGLMDPMNQGPESPLYEENEFNFNRKALRKSSSLKTNKTPPGTPYRKKAVRFADAMGLDLESVRHVLNTNSPPKIPPSAMADLQAGLSEDRKELGSKYLCACFNQPGASEDFYQRVIRNRVSLENAIITDLTITGFVRVANISYHKSVRVRYTDNAWATFHDIAASYVQSSCDGPTDRFSFSLVAPAYFVPGHSLEFALSYNAGGTEYWDNNGGQNYVFECFAKTVPTESESAWMHFL